MKNILKIISLNEIKLIKIFLYLKHKKIYFLWIIHKKIFLMNLNISENYSFHIFLTKKYSYYFIKNQVFNGITWLML